MNKKYGAFAVIILMLVVVSIQLALAGYTHSSTKDADDQLDYETIYLNSGVQYIDTTDATGSANNAELLTIVPTHPDYINGEYSTKPGGRWLNVTFEVTLINGTIGSNNNPRFEYCWVRLYEGGEEKPWVNMSATAGWTAAADGGDRGYLNLTDDTYAAGKFVSNGTIVSHGYQNITLGEWIDVRPILYCNTNVLGNWGYCLSESCHWYVRGWT